MIRRPDSPTLAAMVILRSRFAPDFGPVARFVMIKTRLEEDGLPISGSLRIQ